MDFKKENLGRTDKTIPNASEVMKKEMDGKWTH